jgi:hypothetical protein
MASNTTLNARKLPVFADQRAEAHERSHYFDVDSNGLLALQHGRQHCDALFGEGVGP